MHILGAKLFILVTCVIFQYTSVFHVVFATVIATTILSHELEYCVSDIK